MGISVFKIFTIFGAVSLWAEKALADGIITIKEAAELGETLGAALGVPTSIDVRPPLVAENTAPVIETEDVAAAEEATLTPAEWLEKNPPSPEGGEQ